MENTKATILSIISLSLMAFSTQANQVTGTMNVFAEIGDGCSVNNVDSSGGSNDFGEVNFGSHSVLSAFIDAQGGGPSGVGFEMNCTDGLDYSIGLSDGLNVAGGQRRMTDGDGNFIAYQLYQDSGRSVEWRDIGIGGLTATGSGTTETHLVYGRINPMSTPPAGLYSDTVQVTVTW